ncbi:hypothetical protein KR067_006946 [Drosophila pandora]|nr:hypothetical protein KR067_006946 [Drosophila pandora]
MSVFGTASSSRASIDRRTEMAEKRKTMEHIRKSKGMRTINASMFIRPSSMETRYSFTFMSRRHKNDAKYVDPDYDEKDIDLGLESYVPQYQVQFDDEKETVREPDFKRHKIPLQVRCVEMYHETRREYSRQSKKEIRLLIDNQPNADCAWQFVRIMAYTTLWPPLHTKNELKIFEDEFCRLTPKEQRRYDKIMLTNII